MKRLLLIVALLPGCVTIAAPHSPTVISWSKDIRGAGEWAAEARSRFGDDVVLFVCHGTSTDGSWVVVPDSPRHACPVESVAWALHDACPGREVVMITCNPAGRHIDVPGVWYSLGNVWSHPGPDKREYGDGVGDISEFVTR